MHLRPSTPDYSVRVSLYSSAFAQSVATFAPLRSTQRGGNGHGPKFSCT
jgi:hypothetical protein